MVYNLQIYVFDMAIHLLNYMDTRSLLLYRVQRKMCKTARTWLYFKGEKKLRHMLRHFACEIPQLNHENRAIGQQI